MADSEGMPERMASILQRIAGKDVQKDPGSILKQRYQAEESLRENLRPNFNSRYGGMHCRVYLVRENNQQPIIIKTSEAAYNLVKDELASADRETMLSILLTGHLSLIGVETVAVGLHNTVGGINGRAFQERPSGKRHGSHFVP